MDRKYHLDPNDTIKVGNKVLYRIIADKSFNDVIKGEKGGYIESENNLSQFGNCWVYDGNAYQKHYNTLVYDMAIVYGDAQVRGCSTIYDSAEISEHAIVEQSAIKSSKISGYSYVESTRIAKSVISDHVRIDHSDLINAKLSDNAKIVRSSSDGDMTLLVSNNAELNGVDLYGNVIYNIVDNVMMYDTRMQLAYNIDKNTKQPTVTFCGDMNLNYFFMNGLEITINNDCYFDNIKDFFQLFKKTAGWMIRNILWTYLHYESGTEEMFDLSNCLQEEKLFIINTLRTQFDTNRIKKDCRSLFKNTWNLMKPFIVQDKLYFALYSNAGKIVVEIDNMLKTSVYASYRDLDRVDAITLQNINELNDCFEAMQNISDNSIKPEKIYELKQLFSKTQLCMNNIVKFVNEYYSGIL